MTPAELKAALRAGRNLFGTLIVSPSPFWPKVIGDCGLDFVFIDTEHIALDRQTLSWMCRAYAALGLPPLVRIPNHDPIHHWLTPEQQARFVSMGANLLIHKADIIFFRSGLRQELAEIRRHLRDSGPDRASESVNV